MVIQTLKNRRSRLAVKTFHCDLIRFVLEYLVI